MPTILSPCHDPARGRRAMPDCATIVLPVVLPVMLGVMLAVMLPMTGARAAAFYVKAFSEIQANGFNNGYYCGYSTTEAGSSPTCNDLTGSTGGGTLTAGGTAATSSIASLGNGPTSAYAAADLATGTLHAGVDAAGPVAYAGRGNAIAEISDTLHFTVAGADASTHTALTFTLAIDGMNTYATYNDNTFATMDYYFIDPATNAQDHFYPAFTEASGVAKEVTNIFSQRQTDSFTQTQSSVTGASTVLTYVGLGANFDIAIDARLACSTYFGSDCDFQNTATIGYVAQPGVSFTSDSGVFLTAQDATAVPEPSALVLVGTWLAALAVCGRRGRAGAGVSSSPGAAPGRTIFF